MTVTDAGSAEARCGLRMQRPRTQPQPSLHEAQPLRDARHPSPDERGAPRRHGTCGGSLALQPPKGGCRFSRQTNLRHERRGGLASKKTMSARVRGARGAHIHEPHWQQWRRRYRGVNASAASYVSESAAIVCMFITVP